MKFTNTLKNITILEAALLVVFVLYLILPIETPYFYHEALVSAYGIVLLFSLSVAMFFYANSILAVVFVLVVYELLRRAGKKFHDVVNTTLPNKKPRQKKKHGSPETTYSSETTMKAKKKGDNAKGASAKGSSAKGSSAKGSSAKGASAKGASAKGKAKTSGTTTSGSNSTMTQTTMMTTSAKTTMVPTTLSTTNGSRDITTQVQQTNSKGNGRAQSQGDHLEVSMIATMAPVGKSYPVKYTSSVYNPISEHFTGSEF
jgi:hypothetical protein